jgi:L-alanine-DL-glutamate epimerase-like enolase superfamily enzyme
MYLALGVTSATYVLISLGVFRTLTVDEVTGYGETAIAEAARPTLEDAGFATMAVALCSRRPRPSTRRSMPRAA